jgi:hypothetical protein
MSARGIRKEGSRTFTTRSPALGRVRTLFCHRLRPGNVVFSIHCNQ